MLSSSSVPPKARGVIWSGTVDAVMMPRSLQSRQSGSGLKAAQALGLAGPTAQTLSHCPSPRAALRPLSAQPHR